MHTVPTGDPGKMRTTEDHYLGELIHRPWTLRAGRQPLIVRPSSAHDLASVARMHTRCSARSLLDRYRCGGRAPAVAALDRVVRRPYTIVAATAAGDIVAVGVLEPDSSHNEFCVGAGLLVEDGWQRLGIGTELMAHLAGIAHVAGYHELIAYPATATQAAQRLMIEVGRTRIVPGPEVHLHTYLPEAASLGLGSVRERLAG